MVLSYIKRLCLRSKNMQPAIAIGLVLIGCITNVVFLELLIKEAPGSGNIVTFAQFLFISLEGFIFTSDFCRRKPVIPIKSYVEMTAMYMVSIGFQCGLLYFSVSIPIQMMLRSDEVFPSLIKEYPIKSDIDTLSEMLFQRTYGIMVALFFAVSVSNNYALNFNISMPLHMIFRAGSLMANLILGIIILKKRYDLSKYISVLMISAGIAVATIASAQDIGNSKNPSESNSFHEFMRWLLGITILTFALLMSARMGIYQEQVYSKYGKHPSEALFYNSSTNRDCEFSPSPVVHNLVLHTYHALPLPVFLLLSTDIYNHVIIFNQSDPLLLPLLGISFPKMWVYLAGNVVTQYVCIRGVFILTTECASLTVTLVVTLRKFISLLFSIIYFQNPFTAFHWLGTFLVFGGTLLFSGGSKIKEMMVGKKKEE